jgi:hypothetical protein
VSARVPSYRLHKPTGQAVVTLNGRDRYLGKHNTAESRAEYSRLLAEWLVAGRQLPSPGGRRAVASSPGGQDGGSPNDLTVCEMIRDYRRFAEGYYRKGGEPTGEVSNIKLALRPLLALYGHTSARDFGPLALKAVREEFIRSGLCRNECNRRTRLIVRAFKWGVENEKVPLISGSSFMGLGILTPSSSLASVS